VAEATRVSKVFPDTCEVGKYFLFLLCLEKTGINNLEVIMKHVVDDLYISTSQYKIYIFLNLIITYFS
jgi:hypothetical protein